MEPETVTVDKKHYEALLKRDRKLGYLEEGGVDNWEWYSESLKGYYADDDDDDDDDDDPHGDKEDSK